MDLGRHMIMPLDLQEHYHFSQTWVSGAFTWALEKYGDNGILKVYSKKEDAQYHCFSQMHLHKLGIAPPVLESCRNFGRDMYGDKWGYVSALAQTRKSTVPRNDGNRLQYMTYKLKYLLILNGIVWGDSHWGNTGLYDNKLVVIDPGMMLLAEACTPEYIAESTHALIDNLKRIQRKIKSWQKEKECVLI